MATVHGGVYSLLYNSNNNDIVRTCWLQWIIIADNGILAVTGRFWQKNTHSHNTYTYSIYRILYFCTHDVLLPISLDIYAVRWIRLILEVIYRFLMFAGDNLKVCQSKKSCCNAATEARLIDMVDSEYKRHLAAQAGYVYDLLNSTAHHLQGKQKTK